MGMKPSSTRLRATLVPTSITWFNVIWAAMVTSAPFWTMIGNGSMLSRSKVNGSGLLPAKKSPMKNNNYQAGHDRKLLMTKQSMI